MTSLEEKLRNAINLTRPSLESNLKNRIRERKPDSVQPKEQINFIPPKRHYQVKRYFLIGSVISILAASVPLGFFVDSKITDYKRNSYEQKYNSAMVLLKEDHPSKARDILKKLVDGSVSSARIKRSAFYKYDSAYKKAKVEVGKIIQLAYLNNKCLSYNTELDGIGRKLGFVGDEIIASEVKYLASKLENDKEVAEFELGKSILGKIKNFSYTKRIFIDGKTEKKLVKEGYFDKVWVPPQYKTVHNPVVKGLETTAKVVSVLMFQTKELDKEWNLGDKKEKISEGYYKEGVWHEPVYEQTSTPGKYQTFLIKPFTGEKRLIKIEEKK